MSSALQEGTIFAGRYGIIRCIAMGGMGAVYEVLHIETDRRRALKVMHAHILESEELRERFKREAKVAAHIESAFIVDVFDAGVDEATKMPFMVMELLRGEELGERLKRVGRFSPEESLIYLHQTALALDKTHAASIVHRDLKPANLFLTTREDGAPHIKVLDFGVAKVIADGATQANATSSLGTPIYMSPEQFRGMAKLSPAADIYALGMMTYTFLVGKPYWAAEAASGDIFAFAAIAVHGPPEPASVRAAQRGVRLPPGFDAWFMKAIAPNPTDRFATATAAVSALAEVLGLPLPMGGVALAPGMTPPGGLGSGRFVSSPSITGTERTGATAERRSRSPLIVVVSLGLLVLGGGLFFAIRALRVPSADDTSGSQAPTHEAAAATAASSSATITVAPAITSGAPLVEPAGPAVSTAASASNIPGQEVPPKPAVRSSQSLSGKSAPTKAAAPAATVAKPPQYTRE